MEREGNKSGRMGNRRSVDGRVRRGEKTTELSCAYFLAAAFMRGVLRLDEGERTQLHSGLVLPCLTSGC